MNVDAAVARELGIAEGRRLERKSKGVLALLDGHTREGRLTFIVDDADLPMKQGFYRLTLEDTP